MAYIAFYVNLTWLENTITWWYSTWSIYDEVTGMKLAELRDVTTAMEKDGQDSR